MSALSFSFLPICLSSRLWATAPLGTPQIPALHSRWSSRHFGFEKNGMGTTQEGASCKVSVTQGIKDLDIER